MRHQFTLEYWRAGKWFVGRLVEAPGVFSQGATLDELDQNIRDAFDLLGLPEEAGEVTRQTIVDPPNELRWIDD